MTVCIIGGTGFIGRHLCTMLHNNNIRTIATSRAPDYDFLSEHAPSVLGMSIDDPELWGEMKYVNTCIYLGSGSRPASSWRAPEHEIESNVLSTATALRRVFDINPRCHLIYTSSGGQIYGKDFTQPISEHHKPVPLTTYGLGKLFIEEMIEFFGNIDNVKYTILRIANPIGQWQVGGKHGFVSASVNACIRGDTLNIYGTGHNKRDYFDVDDLCELVVRIIINNNNKCHGVFNVGSGIGLTELDIIKIVENVVDKKIILNFKPPRPFDLPYAVLDASKVERELGWTVKTPLDESIYKIYQRILLDK